MGDTAMPWEEDDTALPWEEAASPPAALSVPAKVAPKPPPPAAPPVVLKSADSTVEALFEKFDRPAYFSKNLPTMEIAAFDAKAEFVTQETFHLSNVGLTDAECVSLASAFQQAHLSKVGSCASGMGESACGCAGVRTAAQSFS